MDLRADDPNLIERQNGRGARDIKRRLQTVHPKHGHNGRQHGRPNNIGAAADKGQQQRHGNQGIAEQGRPGPKD